MLRNSLVRSFVSYRREHGLKAALVRALQYLKIYHRYTDVAYPATGARYRVLESYFWERFSRGLWETGCMEHLAKTVKPGSTIIDVGAWLGPYTLLFSALAGKDGRVYAFEPDPSARYILEKNIRKNRLENVTVESLALSNTAGRTRLYFPSGRGSSGSSLIRKSDEKSPSSSVETVTLDDYCRERSIRPDGIKIDVEGAEGLVIQGAQAVIQEYKPWVMLEFHGQFMPAGQKEKTWQSIVGGAKKVVFLSGESRRYGPGSEVSDLPDCDYFNVFIEF